MKLNWQKEYELFRRDGKFYNYAPSCIQISNHERYLFYCSNKEEGVIRDYIMLRKGILKNEKWFWNEEKCVLSPSIDGWDNVHVCDPDIVAGKFFLFDKIYTYLMFYLGASEDTSAGNQIGVAYAETIEGPWIKRSLDPFIINSSIGKWGVGQSCTTSIDGKGLLRLYYTQQDAISTKIIMRDVDLSDLCNPILKEQRDVLIQGLTRINGEPERVLNNGDIVYDSFRKQLILIRQNHPTPKTQPDFVSSHLQIATIPDTYFLSGGLGGEKQIWQILGTIGPEYTGYFRNHNPGFVKNKYGCLVNPHKLEAIFSVAEEQKFPQSLWTYRLHIAEGDLSPLI